MLDSDIILYRLLQAMADKIEQMEVEGEAKDKVSRSTWKDYSEHLFLYKFSVDSFPANRYTDFSDCW